MSPMCQFRWLDLILFKKLLISRHQIMRKAETVQAASSAGGPLAPPAEKLLKNDEPGTDGYERVGKIEHGE